MVSARFVPLLYRALFYYFEVYTAMRMGRSEIKNKNKKNCVK